MKRLLEILSIILGGLSFVLIIPILSVMMMSVLIWGPETIDGLGSSHISHWFYTIGVSTMIGLFAHFYFIYIVFPFTAKMNVKVHPNDINRTLKMIEKSEKIYSKRSEYLSAYISKLKSNSPNK